MSKENLLLLQMLTSAQFTQLVHELTLPPEYVPHNASQTEMATELLRYLRQQPDGTERLRHGLRKILPSVFDNNKHSQQGLQVLDTEDQDHRVGQSVVDNCSSADGVSE